MFQQQFGVLITTPSVDVNFNTKKEIIGWGWRYLVDKYDPPGQSLEFEAWDLVNPLYICSMIL